MSAFRFTSASGTLTALATCLAATACFDPVEPEEGIELECSVSLEEMGNLGAGFDGIPSLQNPAFVGPEDAGAAYVSGGDRVIGLVVDGEPIAIPHNILWWHEIVNLDLESGERLAVTYSPLTGSSRVFERGAVDGATLGVSGLVYRSNLMMFERRQPSSLWVQMTGRARCGPSDGTRLVAVPSFEATWAGWQALYPTTRVLNSLTPSLRDYTVYPYGDYEELWNEDVPIPEVHPDPRRAPKERVLGIPGANGSGGVAFPLLALDAGAARARAIHGSVAGRVYVVLWESDVGGAMAFHPELDGAPIELTVENQQIVDVGTGSIWRADGSAVEGALAGRSLAPLSDAHVAFWFAWTEFHPETELWSEGGS